MIYTRCLGLVSLTCLGYCGTEDNYFCEKGISEKKKKKTYRSLFSFTRHALSLTWRMSLIMHRKGAGGSRYPGQKKCEGKGKLIKKGLSVHSKNLRIFATPLLVVFVFVRSLAYQFLLAVVLVGQYSRRALNIRGDSKAIGYHTATDPMSNNRRTRSPVGPGEPALATQKRHHRKAFEYISKALKIDEEDGGEWRRITAKIILKVTHTFQI